jgi:Domain of unknown function (DUF4337)
MSFEEEMEHAAHAGHEGHGEGHDDKKGGIGKYIGMTMAILGVMLALTSALLGGSRNKLIATMVEQTNTAGRYQAVSMKYRTLMAQLQQLHALLPADASDFEKAEKEIDSVSSEADKTQVAAIKVNRLETAKILNTVTPTGSDVLRFVELVRDYQEEKEKAEKWTESYEDLIVVYEHGAEHYEWGQLCAEFGIVLASIALLLQSRAAWIGSMSFGTGALVLIVYAFSVQQSGLAHAEHEVEEAKKAYLALNMDEKSKKGDEELLADIERIEKPATGEHSAPTPTPAPTHAPEHH